MFWLVSIMSLVMKPFMNEEVSLQIALLWMSCEPALCGTHQQ